MAARHGSESQANSLISGVRGYRGGVHDVVRKTGDRLLAADGVSLASAEQSAALLQTLTAGTAVSASIERGGQVVALRLDGRNFAGHDAAGAASNGSDQAQ